MSKDLALVEGFFNSVTGKLSAPKPKKKDSKQELLDKFKFVASFQGTEEYKKEKIQKYLLVNKFILEKLCRFWRA